MAKLLATNQKVKQDLEMKGNTLAIVLLAVRLVVGAGARYFLAHSRDGGDGDTYPAPGVNEVHRPIRSILCTCHSAIRLLARSYYIGWTLIDSIMNSQSIDASVLILLPHPTAYNDFYASAGTSRTRRETDMEATTRSGATTLKAT